MSAARLAPLRHLLLLRSRLPAAATSPASNFLRPSCSAGSWRPLSTAPVFRQKEDAEGTEGSAEANSAEDAGDDGGGDGPPEGQIRDARDRSRKIPVEMSLRYMQSAAYRETYGDSRVWELYRRNFAKGKTYVPTRRTCILEDQLITGNPCPICRDEYLVVDYRNVPLISQFLQPYNGELVDRERAGVCRRQWTNLRVALEKARDHGYLDIDPPFVEYDYDKYRPRDDEEVERDGEEAAK